MSGPTGFNVETIEHDWADPEGRWVIENVSARGIRQGFHAKFENGWWLSAAWGIGSYSEAGGSPDFMALPDTLAPYSSDCEVAVWREGFVPVGRDENGYLEWVVPHVTPEKVWAALEAASRDDREAILTALKS